jgi:hypothetical protein
LPQHRLDTRQRTAVRSEKTLWVRFDRNDYSIPPAAGGKDLVLLAETDHVRLFDGLQEVASHRRSYHRGEQITDPLHAQELLLTKRAARGSAVSPLRLAVPEVDRFLDAAFPRYRKTVWLTERLDRLLALYGPDLLRAALAQALEHNTATLDSVEYLIEKHRRDQHRRPPLPVDLTDRPDLAKLHVQPHALDGYDQLAGTDPEDDHE